MEGSIVSTKKAAMMTALIMGTRISVEKSVCLILRSKLVMFFAFVKGTGACADMRYCNTSISDFLLEKECGYVLGSLCCILVHIKDLVSVLLISVSQKVLSSIR